MRCQDLVLLRVPSETELLEAVGNCALYLLREISQVGYVDMWYLPLFLVIDIETRDQRKRAGSDCLDTEKMVSTYGISQTLEDL